MKKYLSILLIICMIFIMGCNEKSDTDTGTTSAKLASRDGIDIDLTLFSTTLAYAELSNIVESPQKYMGKTMKMKGTYNVQYVEIIKIYYHYIIIEDSTICCFESMEFKWTGHTDFADFPENGAVIEITGVFGSYDERGKTFYYVEAETMAVK